jgi:phosphopantothenoylcysteine decarboxylase/phosphopantothenate--cysteine ligase
VVVSAGPTFEDIDPVRYVGNRSSGRMGYAIAAEAARRGAAVTLVSGPSALAAPSGVEVVRVRTAAEMRDAVVSRAPSADIVVMAAAVADYAPVRAPEKIAKDPDELVLRMARTPDILSELGERRARGEFGGTVLVGFAAETGDVVARAREKRRRKQVDLIVANDVSQADRGFEVDQNAVTLITADDEQDVTRRPKAEVARAILDRVEALRTRRPGAADASAKGGK